MKIVPLLAFLLCSAFFSGTCRVDETVAHYQTKHVIVVVVDGARYTETWGDSLRQYIPFRAQTLLPQSVMLQYFRNEGYTWTNAGHCAICTAHNEPLDNGGNEFPTYPTMFQYWRKATGKPSEKAWIITSKDKLFVLANTRDTSFQTKWMPRYDCGLNGPNTGYRDDSITYHHVISTFNLYHPDLVLVNFREPDYSGHTGNWTSYVNGIRSTDAYLDSIWSYLQRDPYYAGTTALIVTNDHGRHLTGHLDGFQSHGDNCEGCRHIEFVASGPDFKRNAVLDVNYDLRDIPRTISEILSFPMPTGEGKVMRAILK